MDEIEVELKQKYIFKNLKNKTHENKIPFPIAFIMLHLQLFTDRDKGEKWGKNTKYH